MVFSLRTIQILELYLKDKAPGANIDEIAAVSMGCSGNIAQIAIQWMMMHRVLILDPGADLYNVVNTALIEAIKHNKTHVTTELLQEALSIIQMGMKSLHAMPPNVHHPTSTPHLTPHSYMLSARA